MDDLLAKALMGSLSADEERTLAAWRKADPANEIRYCALARAWSLVSEPDSTEALPLAPAPAQIIARAGIRVLPGPLMPAAKRGRRTVGLLVGAAALAAAILLWAPWSARPALRPAPLGVTEFTTGPGESSLLHLNDGSIVRLGPSSHLRFDGSASQRRTVRFRGRGFFAVATDSLRPFVVQTDAGTAEVLGTQFQIESEAVAMKVVVVEGRVAVNAGGGRREVAANQQATTTNGSPPALSEVPSSSARADWLGDLLVFQEQPLVKAIEVLERRYGISIELRDPTIGHRAVTAWMQERDYRQAMDVICRVVAAQCTTGERSVVIHGSERVPDN